MKTQIQFIEKPDTKALQSLKQEWHKTLVAPQDDMWEAFTEQAMHWAIVKEDQTIGYAVVNEENCLLQFFINASWLPEGVAIFQEFILQQKITQAIIGTNNPICLSIAMHIQKTVSVHTYLFADMQSVGLKERSSTLKNAGPDDLERVVDFCQMSMGAPKAWLNVYIGNLINRSEFFILEEGAEILGTCEVRKSESNPSVAAVGMVVSPEHRKQRVGTYLLGKAKEIALQWGRQAICSCEKDNIGSLKAIQNNGFRSIHQMLGMEF